MGKRLPSSTKMEQPTTSAFPTLGKVYHGVYSFLVFYTFLLVFSIPIQLLILYRFLLSLNFSIFYKGKFKLMSTMESYYSIDRFANLMVINFFLYIKGPCDIAELRQRFTDKFFHFQENGKRPYETMMCSAVKKFGFMCWENKRNAFDVTRHVRFCPGVDQLNRVYTEDEVLASIAKLNDDLWNENLPKWEALVVPKLKKDGSNEECSAICFRVSHAYADGISVAQILRNVIADQPAPKLILDPVNPPIPLVPWYMNIIWWVQVFFVGPYASLKLMWHNEDHVFYEGPLTGGKYFGLSHTFIPVEVLKNIRSKVGCSTSAIIHSAFNSAMQNVAVKKGFKKLPTHIIGGTTFANLPFPDEYPRNNLYFGGAPFPLGIEEPLRRLSANQQVYEKLATSPTDKLAAKLVITIIGLFPEFMIASTFGSIRFSYYVSNVPGINGVASFNGFEVSNVFGTGPLVNGIRYHVGATFYENKLSCGFFLENSNVIKSRSDVNDFIREFEKEMDHLNAIC